MARGTSLPRFAVIMLALLVVAPAHAALTDVVIRGVDGELRDNVRARLGIVEVLNDDSVPDSHVNWLHDRAPGQIRKALEPFGYYSVSVEAGLETTEEGLRAIYRVKRGDPVRVRESEVELAGGGSEDRVLLDAVRDFPLQEGDRLDHRRYEEGKRRIERLLAERGYFDAKSTRQVVEVDAEAGRAVIRLHWRTGPRYRFGAVQFDGGQFPDDFMQRFVEFERGRAFHQSKLLDLQRTLLDTDYFAQVDINVLSDEAAELEAPVRVTLSPRKRDVYSAGLGFGTDSGPRVEGGFQRRWLNRRGHRFRIDGEFGERRSGLNTQYGIPVYRDDIRRYTVGARYLTETSESVDRRSSQVSVGREAVWHGWQQIISLNVLVERFELRLEEGAERFGDTQDATVLYPMLRLSRSRADDALVPRRGWRLEGYVRAGADTILSDTSFVQLGADARLILPGPGDDRVLLRAEAATTWADDFLRLPASLRNFAGGDRSLRGFRFQELGPTGEAGEVLGGEHLLVGSAEYEHMLTERWGVAAFVDAGNAFSGTDLDPEVGTGIGLRWRSPVGMMRVDLASAVSQPGDPLKLHLVIGPDL